MFQILNLYFSIGILYINKEYKSKNISLKEP